MFIPVRPSAEPVLLAMKSAFRLLNARAFQGTREVVSTTQILLCRKIPVSRDWPGEKFATDLLHRQRFRIHPVVDRPQLWRVPRFIQPYTSRSASPFALVDQWIPPTVPSKRGGVSGTTGLKASKRGVGWSKCEGSDEWKVRAFLLWQLKCYVRERPTPLESDVILMTTELRWPKVHAAIAAMGNGLVGPLAKKIQTSKSLTPRPGRT